MSNTKSIQTGQERLFLIKRYRYQRDRNFERQEFKTAAVRFVELDIIFASGQNKIKMNLYV